jgi:succinate dehydrogenase / fumarate reductase iron-sulfur subunit
MRSFKDGDAIHIEPWRSLAFPVVRDLVVDRGSFDRIVQAGGYVSINAGAAQDANCLPISKPASDTSMDAAACIGCGACVASCPNGSAMLFVSAKIGHLAHLPQGQPERYQRARDMVAQMDAEGFGACSNHYECEAVCPKEIPVKFIAKMNRDFFKATLCSES